ncbi:hypothetical protein SH668x_003716 [Planctomicrobium sp. SH668]|jgi:hypothetical protein|uniref:hypothetical protein n=1 Tax=Planctomicrobium sp. SH668 TaxID=3448126 RepID=UPI003F5C164B|nr:hypothetical protein [Planctomycetaceae bacterium]
MSDFDWLIIQLQLLVWGFLIFVTVMVLAPVALIARKVNKDREKRQEEANRLSAAEPPAITPGIAMSEKDGRVIAMEAMEPQPVMPGTPPPQKSGGDMAMKVAKHVAGKAAGAVAKHYLRRWLLGR